MPPEVVSFDSEERAKHESAIASLSEQYRVPPDAVAQVYERELVRLKKDALITSYLSILVTRRVNELLRGGSAGGDPQGRGGPAAHVR